MKNRGIVILLLSFFIGTALSSAAQDEKEPLDRDPGTDRVEVYYFHFERRCATCMAVETESEKALRELYPKEVETGQITFLSINLEEETNETLAEKLNVSGQTLLVVKGDKQDNLTNVAFMHARTNPEKLKDAIRESVGKL